MANLVHYIPPRDDGAYDEDGPYGDYGRSLTAEGGILIIYKDIDDRLRHHLWRWAAWLSFTGVEAGCVFGLTATEPGIIEIGCLTLAALLNWLIIYKSVEVYRRIEVRPDCLIIDGAEVFWRGYFAGGWPQFESGEGGVRRLCGTYGTRYVEFLRARPFDANDRAPDILAMHVQDALMQLWSQAL